MPLILTDCAAARSLSRGSPAGRRPPRSPRRACRTRSAPACRRLLGRRRTRSSGSPRSRSARAATQQNSTASAPTSALTKYVPCGRQRPQPGSARPAHSWSRLARRSSRSASMFDAGRPQRRRGGVLERRSAGERQELLDRPGGRDQLGRARAQPTFQPVNENVLPTLEIVSVRSRHPRAASPAGMCSPSKTRCS